MKQNNFRLNTVGYKTGQSSGGGNPDLIPIPISAAGMFFSSPDTFAGARTEMIDAAGLVLWAMGHRDVTPPWIIPIPYGATNVRFTTNEGGQTYYFTFYEALP